jgi:hypothetical protein
MFNSINKRPFPDSNWVNFRRESVGLGWTDPTSILLYKIINDIMYVIYRIEGTSNSTSAYFTIPQNFSKEQDKFLTAGQNISQARYSFPCVAVDNNTTRDGFLIINQSAATTILPYEPFNVAKKSIIVQAFSSVSGYSGWTNTGTKSLNGQFFMPL